MAAVEARENGKDTGTTPPASSAAPPATSVPGGTDIGTTSGAPVATTNRGPDGRFQTASGTPPEGSGAAPPAPGTPVGTPPAAAPSGAGTGAVEAPGTPPPAGVSLDPSRPPPSWRPETRAKWDSIPEDIRQEIIRREEDTSKGVAKLKAQYEPMERMYKEVNQHQKYFEHIKREPGDYLQEMIHTEQSLTLGNPAQKMELLLQLADNYGVPLRDVIDKAMGGTLSTVLQQSHQRFGTPAPVPREVQAELNRYRSAEQSRAEAQAQAELDAFIGDGTKHPHYEKVAGKMADLMDKGVVETYEEAYEMAVWSDPSLRTSLTQVIPPPNDPVAQRQAQAAAVSTPAPNATITPPNVAPEDESVEDTIRKAWAKAAVPGGV